MADPHATLTVDQRRAIFAAVVTAQDEGLAVPSSRELVAGRFAVTVAQVADIEREGIENGWPPL